MYKPKLLSLLLTLILTAFSQLGFSQSDKAKKIDEYVTPFVKADHFSGVILASENGKVIYEKAFGLANADYKIPNQLNTRIGIASVTKPMTVVILNRLVENNKISLEDKLSKYIPDFPNGDKITIGHLKNHRSGIPHRVMPPELEAVSYTSAGFVEKVKQAKSEFEPGSQRTYSSAGFSVLARALEIASGKSYSQLLQEFVFTPANMKDSLDFNGEMIMERRAQDYLLDSNGYINAPLKDYSFLVGAGSVFSTARDVYKFGEAVLDGKYGENAKTDLIGKTTISASGTTNGHRAYLEIERDKKYGYVLLSNLPTGAFDIISQGLTDILQGKEPKPLTPIPQIIPNPNKNMAEFSGSYRRTDGIQVEVELRNDFLYALGIKFYPIKPDCFFEYKYYGEVCFTREGSGKIKEMKWKGNGFEYFYVKQ
ncbi:MAG: beta-lactamase family protein [Acidobacteriota bacterium]|nr:beta-lactamase family protein [Acidobacteriota bacterium]